MYTLHVFVWVCIYTQDSVRTVSALIGASHPLVLETIAWCRAFIIVAAVVCKNSSCRPSQPSRQTTSVDVSHWCKNSRWHCVLWRKSLPSVLPLQMVSATAFSVQLRLQKAKKNPSWGSLTEAIVKWMNPSGCVLIPRSSLFQNFLTTSSCPEIQGHLYVKEVGRKSWKKVYMFLRRSGLYCSTKGTSKVRVTRASHPSHGIYFIVILQTCRSFFFLATL